MYPRNLADAVEEPPQRIWGRLECEVADPHGMLPPGQLRRRELCAVLHGLLALLLLGEVAVGLLPLQLFLLLLALLFVGEYGDAFII